MKKILVSPTTCMLTGLLTLMLTPGCSIETPSTVQVSQAQQGRKTQWASNAQGDLFGENLGDGIVLDWDLHDGATEYKVYRSTSLAGPWEQVLRTRQVAASTGGAREDLTPDASLMDLCYKVEALDAAGAVIRTYEPICIPKFAP